MNETLLLHVEIKASTMGGWYLLLENTITEKTFECQNVIELNEKLTLLQSLYPQHTLEVVWLEADDTVLPSYINDIRHQLTEVEASLQEK